MNRRQFLRVTTGLGGGALLSHLGIVSAVSAAPAARPRVLAVARRTELPPTRIAFVKTRNRAEGVRKALDLLDINPVRDKALFLKANFNSADPTPGSTHNDTLSALVQRLQEMGAASITIGDRSGMGDTRTVMQQKGLFDMADELGFQTVVFDELGPGEWELLQPEDSHWNEGFWFARPVLRADGVVQTCCLKTHQYGGHFTLSLKNSVGLVAKYSPTGSANYMSELHGSGHQRRMIAEINTAYAPDLIVLDGVQAFVNGGPATGDVVDSRVILAGTDRVAIDAVGVAILRHFGTTEEVERGPIFEQEQIARAVELGLGVDSPDKIALITGDPASAAYAAAIGDVLMAG